MVNIAPINSDDEKVRCKMSTHILDLVLLAIVLLFIIIAVCFYCMKHESKQEILTHEQYENICIN